MIAMLASCVHSSGSGLERTPPLPECEGGMVGGRIEARGCSADLGLIDLPPLPRDARVDVAVGLGGRDARSYFARIRTDLAGPRRQGLLDGLVPPGEDVHRASSYAPPADWPLNPDSADPEVPPEWWDPGPAPTAWRQDPDPFVHCPGVAEYSGGTLVVDDGADGIYVHGWLRQWFYPDGGCGG